jgi:cobalt-zinc-cadmium efflux system protein
MTHHQEHTLQVNERHVAISVVLNFGITLLEFIGGLLSNSLALVSDAFHNLGDTVAISLSYLALRFGKKPSNEHKTFGYKRIEILAALFNATVLIAISIYLFFEAWGRFRNPQPVKGILMLSIATVGLLANLSSVVLLRKDSSHNLNVRTAYMHLLGDTLSSLGVMAGAIFMILFRLYWIDPLLTVLIGLFIIKETYAILRDTINILMESTPKGMDIEKIKAVLEKDPRIDNVHHIHIWQLSDQQVHFECHVDFCNDLPLSMAEEVRKKLEAILQEQFHIHHVTIQMEFNACEEKGTIMES